MNKKIIFSLILIGMINIVIAGQPGMDYIIRTAGSWSSGGTVYGKKCADMTFYRVDGTVIPSADIQCCDFDKDGFYLGTGTNCWVQYSFRDTTNPNWKGNDPTITWTWGEQTSYLIKRNNVDIAYIYGYKLSDDSELKFIAKTGVVTIWNSKLKIGYELVNLDELHHGTPYSVNYMLVKDEIVIETTPTNGNAKTTFKYDAKSTEAKLYSMYGDKVITAYPNPVEGDGKLTFSKNISSSCDVILYNQNGSKVLSTSLTSGKNEISTSDLKKGIYWYVAEMNGKTIKSGLIVLQ